ncbi:hypothetical protein PR048_001619 [Dryococelus australis]|uniref:Uncharacterized protein n=1 Tax=Dryococelus australis TaxID=614101 RepID=A0ABQ9IJA9_9NEOP|nr:hypothetical protein PR048_001619 [Dryococelus australis]
MTSTTDNISCETHSKVIFNLKPHAVFYFSSPLLWKQWKQHFCQYMSVSGYMDKTDNEKIDILLYDLGEKAEELWTHFTPHLTMQGAEIVDEFINSLHTLADTCDYGLLRHKHIRDRIVVGMKDKKISEQSQLQSSLSLDETILVAKQLEMQSQ